MVPLSPLSRHRLCELTSFSIPILSTVGKKIQVVTEKKLDMHAEVILAGICLQLLFYPFF